MNTLVVLQKMGLDLLKIENPEFRELLIDIFRKYVFYHPINGCGSYVSWDIEKFDALKKFIEDYILAKETANRNRTVDGVWKMY